MPRQIPCQSVSWKTNACLGVQEYDKLAGSSTVQPGPDQPPKPKPKLTCCSCTVVGCELGIGGQVVKNGHARGVTWPATGRGWCRLQAAIRETKQRRNQEGRGCMVIVTVATKEGGQKRSAVGEAE